MARNTSAAYKEQIKGVRQFCAKIIITYPDDTVDTLTDLSDFMKLKIEDACSGTSDFSIGSAIINEAVITLNNRTGKFDGKNFYGAKITAYAGIMVNNLPELLKMGQYIVDEPVSPGVSINLVAYDRMVWMDRTYQPGIVFPATLGQIASDACSQCGVPLKSADFPRAGYIVQTVPEDGHTCREILAAAAQLAGCFARCDPDGQTEIRWYSADVTHEISSLRSRNICTDDVTITGIIVESGSSTAAQAGAEGYRLAVKDNILLESGKEQETADYLAEKLVGMTFRPLSITCKSDMSIEAGDKVTVKDERGNSYTTFVTSTTFAMLENQSVACNAASPTVNSSQRLSQAAQAVIQSHHYTQEYVQGALNGYQTASSMFGELLASAMGYYETTELQEDGSVITYMHDKPLLEDSQTIWKKTIDGFAVSTDGGETWHGMDKNGNAVLNVIAVNGLDAGYINSGTLTAKDKDGNIVFMVNVDTGQVLINASAIITSTGQTVQQMMDGVHSSYVHIKYSDDGRTFTGNILVNLTGDDWENGHYSYDSGEKQSYANRIRMCELIPIEPDTKYLCNTGHPDILFVLRAYDENQKFIHSIGSVENGQTVTTWANECYLGVSLYSEDSTIAIGMDNYQELVDAGLCPDICKTEGMGDTVGEWIGTLVDENETASTVFGDYTWKKFSGDLDDEIGNIYTEIERAYTNATAAAEAIILEAVREYTRTSDFETFRQTVSAQLQLLSDQMTLQFSQVTEQLVDENNALQSQINSITKLFTFSVDGFTIGDPDSPYRQILDNGWWAFEVNGEEKMWMDAETGELHTPETHIDDRLVLFHSYVLEQDSDENVNCIYVEEQKLSSSITASTSSAAAGSSVLLTAKADGGRGRYTYRFLLYNTSTAAYTTLQDYSTRKTYRWTALSAGTYRFYADIKDGSGTVVRSRYAEVTTTGGEVSS